MIHRLLYDNKNIKKNLTELEKVICEAHIVEHNTELYTVKTNQVQQLSMIYQSGPFKTCPGAGQDSIVPDVQFQF